MAQNDGTRSPGKMKIEIIKNGPYYVSGGVPLALTLKLAGLPTLTA